MQDNATVRGGLGLFEVNWGVEGPVAELWEKSTTLAALSPWTRVAACSSTLFAPWGGRADEQTKVM